MAAESGPPLAGDSEEQSHIVPSWFAVLAAFLGAVVGVIAARLGSFGFAGKTVWDYLDVFLVPVAVAAATAWLTLEQNKRQHRDEAAQQESQRLSEKAQRDREFEVADRRAQDEALQAYLDQMGELVLQAHLHTSQAGAEVRVLARARTLTVLERLDASRKTSVMRFLVESALVSKEERKKEGANERLVSHQPVISLHGADLSGADLRGAKLSEADLSEANLRRANLRDADLNRSELVDAKLIDADLRRAKAIRANLSRTELRGADLIAADLSNARLFEAKPINAKLNSAILRGAFLLRADLSGADLRDAKVSRANLRRANLRGAKGIANKDLDQQALTLQDATMPTGEKYEDWLKDKEGRGRRRRTAAPRNVSRRTSEKPD